MDSLLEPGLNPLHSFHTFVVSEEDNLLDSLSLNLWPEISGDP